mmetsp:Transcript_15666/g.14182  ORF Transcript_15666/g.14182 Transcript_15666/m.14182 type:complete len:243 (-) Transcript_15666:233-961(-)
MKSESDKWYVEDTPIIPIKNNVDVWKYTLIGLISIVSLLLITLVIGIQTKKHSVVIETDFMLWSPEFDEGMDIRDTFTCNGEKFSPPFEWIGTPKHTKELFIQMTTPTVDGITYDWTLYHIGASVTSLDTNVDPGSDNDYIVGGTYPYNLYYCYNSPCSTGPGPRNYTFTLYALSKSLLSYDEFVSNSTYTIGPYLLQFAYDHDLVIDTASTYGYAVTYNNPDDHLPTSIHPRGDTVCRIEL